MNKTDPAAEIEVIYSADEIARRLDQLAAEIAARAIPGFSPFPSSRAPSCSRPT